MADEEQRQQGTEGVEGAGGEGAGEQPSEEELRAQLEEEIRKVRVEDVVLQSAVSILNLSARRIAIDEERDLEQAKVGIDAASALVDLVKSDAQSQLRQAISELQVLYAKHAGGESAPEQGTSEKPKGDSGLWTPGGSADG